MFCLRIKMQLFYVKSCFYRDFCLLFLPIGINCYLRKKIVLTASKFYLNQMNSVLAGLFYEATGVQCTNFVRLTGDGSNRSYYRMTAGNIAMIGAVGTSVEENRAFLALAGKFLECGLNAPRVYAVSADELCYIMQDLGDTTLFMLMKDSREGGSFSSKDVDALCRVMQLLPDIQYKIADGWDFSQCYPVSDFNSRSVFWDFNYFKYCFLKGAGIDFDEQLLENEFELLASQLLEESDNTFLYRDFQSRNVMWHDGEPYFIDFQGGRRGPIYYDVASFVGQARARYTPEVVERMLKSYIASLSRYRNVDEKEFMQKLDLFRIFRLLQNLGTYGYRGLFERKKTFVESIPAALMQLNDLLCRVQDFPYLARVVGETARLPRFVKVEEKELTVDVISFSYKRGIPEDYSGNGGGFVFDCRAIHNPGRYEPYKKLTGMDEPVKHFLETESDIHAFLQNAYSLVDNMVSVYLERGFTHIQVCCGCTGGRHRSVYSAEHIARHIADKYAVCVRVNHSMLNVSYTLEKKEK